MTSCVQVHELPQSHCVDNQEGTLFHDYIYVTLILFWHGLCISIQNRWLEKVKLYIKDTNDFLKKIANRLPLPDDLNLCTIDVVGFYLIIPDEEGLIAIRKALDTRKELQQTL